MTRRSINCESTSTDFAPLSVTRPPQRVKHGPCLLTALLLAAIGSVLHPLHAAENVLLVTLDGLRWQELYRGIEQKLATHSEYSPRGELIMERFWHEDPAERARLLMPFMHATVFAQGAHVGNRDADSCAKVSNQWFFSYPGYSEILTGVVNPAIDSNRKEGNPEKTFLELLNARPEFRGRSAAFASWDVFPWIFNSERSGLTVNAMGSTPAPADAFERILVQLEEDIPAPWSIVRHDAFTHHYARAWLERETPRVLFISYGETDDFAHDGRYDEYILAANRTDRFLREMWELVQSLDAYRDKTVLFVTVDHGRGEEPQETWQHHASKTATTGYLQSLAHYEEGIVGSEAVWMAAIGPGVSNAGLLPVRAEDCLTSNRIAATLLQLIGEDYKQLNPAMGTPLTEFLQ